MPATEDSRRYFGATGGVGRHRGAAHAAKTKQMVGKCERKSSRQQSWQSRYWALPSSFYSQFVCMRYKVSCLFRDVTRLYHMNCAPANLMAQIGEDTSRRRRGSFRTFAQR